MSRCRKASLLLLPFVLVVSAAAGDGGAPDTLSLANAASFALERSPELQVFSGDLRAAEARRVQAGLRPNPELSFALENFAGTLPGAAEAEATLSLGQILELGGKRAARETVARADGRAVELDYEVAKHAVLAEVAQRFVAATGAHRVLAFHEETERIAEEVKQSVALKVRAGATSPAEETRAEVELEAARLARADAAQEETLARRRLAALWGETEPAFVALQDGLDRIAAPPPRQDLLARLDRSPRHARLLAEVDAARARLSLAEAERAPDLHVEAGYRHFAAEGDDALVASLSAPLPFWNRNQGAVAEAEAQISRSEADAARARVALALSLTECHGRIERAQARVEALRERILPAAGRAYVEIRTGYERGRFAYVDLLEARRSLADARRQELSTLIEYHLAVADAELLLGGPLNPPPTQEQNP